MSEIDEAIRELTTAEKWVTGWSRFLSEMSERSKDIRTPDEVIAEILSRYTVTDLIEQSNDDLERGDEMFYKAKEQIGIVERGETNNIRWWRIASGANEYEVRRFKNFVWCSCKGFFYSKRMCKHLAFTTGVYCERCRVLPAKNGKLCHDCSVTSTMFRKPSSWRHKTYTIKEK